MAWGNARRIVLRLPAVAAPLVSVGAINCSPIHMFQSREIAIMADGKFTRWQGAR